MATGNCRCKPGVIFEGFTRELALILLALVSTAEKLGLPLVITAGSDGKHKKGSRHYTFQAIDVRSKTLTGEQRTAVGASLRTTLGPKFLVLLENSGTENEHFHIELD